MLGIGFLMNCKQWHIALGEFCAKTVEQNEKMKTFNFPLFSRLLSSSL